LVTVSLRRSMTFMGVLLDFRTAPGTVPRAVSCAKQDVTPADVPLFARAETCGLLLSQMEKKIPKFRKKRKEFEAL